MKILIIDDEYLATSRLERLLREIGENEIVSAKNATEALKIVSEKVFDLVFLDINLPDKLGVELAYAILSRNSAASIVFQTAYENYALKAFEIGAVDYLLKPYSKEQLQRSVERAKRAKETKTHTFMVRESGEYRLLEAKDIYYVKADLSQTIIRAKDWFFYYPKKISDMEKILAPSGFFRIHRSFLINVSKIKKIGTAEQSRLIFYFDGIDESIESSKDGAKLFRQKFGD